MPFLLANWRICIGIVLFATYSAFVYRIGGNPARSELAIIKAAATAQNAHTAAIDIQTKEIAHVADKTASDSFKRIDDAYRMRDVGASKTPHVATVAGQPEPTAETSRVDTCNDRDSAHDAEQVILLQNYYNEQRTAINGM